MADFGILKEKESKIIKINNWYLKQSAVLEFNKKWMAAKSAKKGLLNLLVLSLGDSSPLCSMYTNKE